MQANIHPLLAAEKQPGHLRYGNRSFTGKVLLLACLLFMLINVAYAQKSLKITKVRQITWYPDSHTWSPWPTDWRIYPVDSQPIITISKKDDTGYMFHIDMVVGAQTFSFDIDYNGFDDKNNWTKYMDEAGDEITIVGSNLSYLSQNGWPGNAVQIYFWIYSNNMAMELE
jgi:hypothetical protein